MEEIPFIIAPRKIKYIQNYSKKVKGIYNENHNTLKKRAKKF